MGYILDVSDFIRNELEKIKAGAEADGDEKELHGKIDKFLNRLKNNIAGSGNELPPENVYQEPKRFYIPPVSTPNSKFYIIRITYTPEAQMANIRAYTAVYSLKEAAEDILYEPDDIIINESSADVILENGFTIALQTQENEDEILRLIDHSAGVDQITIRECTPEEFLYLGKTPDMLGTPEKKSVKKEEEDTIIILRKLKKNMYSYLGGVLLVMVFLILISTVCFFIIGINLPLLWGIIIGLTNIIPYIGPYIGGFIVAIFTLGSMPNKIIPVIAIIVVLQLIESNFITPKVESKTVKVHPILAIFSVALLGKILGIFGMILAIPIVSSIQIVKNHKKYN